MKILYARVSSEGQNLDRQLDNIDAYDRVYMEKASGKSRERTELNNMLKAIRDGDEIEVASLDRLGRSLMDLCSLVKEINGLGATIHFKKENFTFKPNVNDPTQDLMMKIMGSFAEFERQLILSRQREGIIQAKKRHVYEKAHPRKLNNLIIQNIKDDKIAGLKERELMNKYHISKPTLYRYLKIA